MAIDTIKSTAVLDGAIATADIADDAVTSAKLDTNIGVAGTLDVTGDFTADSSNSTLFVDASTNRVHIGGGTSDTNTSALSVRKSGGGNFIANFENTSTTAPYGVMVRDPSGSAAGYPLFQVSNSGGNHYFRVDSNTGKHYFAPGGTEKVRIDSDGLKFNGDTAADNALNDYEEGRFDILFADVDGGSETLSMRYTKVGQVVHVEGPNRGSAGSSNGQYAILSAVSNSNINITCSLPFVPIESGSVISPIHRNLELRSSGTTPVSGYWRPMLTWQAGSATVYLADTQGASANEHAYWGGANGQTLRKQDNRTNIVVGFNFSYRTAS